LEENQRHHWQSLLWAAVGSVALLICLAFLPLGPRTLENHRPPPGFGWSWDFDYKTAMAKPGSTIEPSSRRPAVPNHDLLILVIDQPLSVAGLNIVYRGLTPAGRFRLDVVNPALDPLCPYPHEFSPSQARHGFSIFDRRFVLNAIGPSALILRPAAPK
jgi:hypothetical protein